MNIFEERVQEANNLNIPLEQHVLLMHGKKSISEALEYVKYKKYLEFAEKNIGKVGTYETKGRLTTTIVYTEYGPLISTHKKNSDTGNFKHSFEGIFKFNVDNTQKLLYANVEFEETEDNPFASISAIIRREDGSFEDCDWMNNDHRIPDSDDPDQWNKYHNAQQLIALCRGHQRVNITEMEKYFSAQLELIRSNQLATTNQL